MKWLIGVDEVGRGPLAGPVAVGVVCVQKGFDWKIVPGVTDSKKLTEKKREEIYTKVTKLRKEGRLDFAVVMVAAKVIDRIGIVPAINRAKAKAFTHIEKNTNVNISIFQKECLVKLDSGLQAPEEYIHQEIIVKGDSKEKVIGLASIVAKVTRDRHMVRISASPKFAPYNFAIHKGYGTVNHRTVIQKIGLSEIHRASFCRNLLNIK